MPLIHTTRGDVDDSLLERTDGAVENDNEHTTWTEYRFKGETEIVRRDVHVRLKKALEIVPAVQGF